jgi:nitronate monooxygenase
MLTVRAVYVFSFLHYSFVHIGVGGLHRSYALGNPAVKEKLLRANGDETVRSSVFDISRRLTWPAPFTGRALRNAYVDHWLGREADLLRQIDVGATRYAAAAEIGDFGIAVVRAGEVVDLIRDMPPAVVIVEHVVSIRLADHSLSIPK